MIEILVVDGCPHAVEAIDLVHDVVREFGEDISVNKTVVVDQVQRTGFAGSPTILVNGRDVEPGTVRRPTGLACRRYVVGGQVRGTPSRDWIVTALEEAGYESRR
jgi:hypothetical protein